MLLCIWCFGKNKNNASNLIRFLYAMKCTLNHLFKNQCWKVPALPILLLKEMSGFPDHFIKLFHEQIHRINTVDFEWRYRMNTFIFSRSRWCNYLPANVLVYVLMVRNSQLGFYFLQLLFDQVFLKIRVKFRFCGVCFTGFVGQFLWV